MLGGNSAKAASGINGAGTLAQMEKGIADSPSSFKSDVIKSGQQCSDEVLVDRLAKESADAVAFLKGLGIDLSLLSHCGGHKLPRTHRSKLDPTAKFQRNIGSIITLALASKLSQLPNVEIYLASAVTSLLTEGESVKGIQVNGTLEFFAHATVLATGGYGRDARLLKEFCPEYANLPSTNGNWTTGDGVHLARAISVDVTGMEYVQVHPTGIVDPQQPNLLNKFLACLSDILKGCAIRTSAS